MDDALADEESQAGAFADGAGRKERFKDAGEDVGIDTGAGVGDFNEDGVGRDVAEADGELVGGGFGRIEAFVGVGKEVGEDLEQAELVSVGEDRFFGEVPDNSGALLEVGEFAQGPFDQADEVGFFELLIVGRIGIAA